VKILNILYVHGMGGGEDSYGPGVLRELLESRDWEQDGVPCKVRMTLRTYSFDPEEARRQLKAWNEEVSPDLIIGESLGCCHAMMLGGAPHLFLSPGINAFRTLYLLSFPARMKWFREWVHGMLIHEKSGRRQPVSLEPSLLAKYKGLRNEAIRIFKQNAPDEKPTALIGRQDKFRILGVGVSAHRWKKLFGKDSIIWFDCDREAGHTNGHTLSSRQEESLLLGAVKGVLRLNSVT